MVEKLGVCRVHPSHKLRNVLDVVGSHDKVRVILHHAVRKDGNTRVLCLFLNQLSFIDYKELKRLFKKVPELSSYGGSTDEYKFKEAKPYENCDDVLMDLIRRFNITDKAALQDPELLKTIIYELQTRSGVSLRDVAVLVGLDREKIRRTAKKINYNV